ncbi:ATP-dependent RNA helicase DDX54 [Anopheles ziemanni]|uniref:ATP-dependent RNA helicase DDX54 n=1 Tax=Anopheles coustani TaxID=139045 RepID=UPI00265829EC|nr:ATP-dependent RNA helicase DDX54 [Anopheles coustani]XP_058171127.1 ATP-dependent RNA helicase DDX54 [Anopheles ziemanni]
MLAPQAKLDDVPGFSIHNAEVDYDDDVDGGKRSKKKSGGFQAMGLSAPVLKGILKMGYKIPTPIQRKTIPIIMDGRDVVAMAKTGSGKTGCFLIPLFEKLKQREAKTGGGARALILSPTRELAIQTFKFIKQLGRFMDFKTILVLGGDSMDSQFAAVHTLPDIIVATPGRFLHLCVEMDLKLNSVQYCVLDEADRLFEMGFGEQLTETLKRLPEARQMVLFSATLPKLMVDFATAGLCQPVLIRLDVDSKIPETLDLKYIYCRPAERYATLLVLLREVIPKKAQTVIFAGTQHHVELISLMLAKAGIPNSHVYSALDASARKINTARFTMRKVNVLVVTDVAARGLDIPSLDYVVNLHFPGKPKLFIHRVGRCARAGRSGTAFSIFSNDDIAHLIDLHMFLNRPLDTSDRRIFGTTPPESQETEHQLVEEYVQHVDLATIYRVSNNAYKQYIVTRPAASASSNKRAKLFKIDELGILEDFERKASEETMPTKGKKGKKSKQTSVKENAKATQENGETEQKSSNAGNNSAAVDPDAFRNDFLARMKSYRPQATIFELNPKAKARELNTMIQKREKDELKIEKHKRKLVELEAEEHAREQERQNTQADDGAPEGSLKRKKKGNIRDDEHFISYQAKDAADEDGYAIDTFARQANSAELSVAADTADGQRLNRQLQKWDRKKKKMVNVEDPRAGKIRTEHGVWIAASYKTGRYDKWKDRTKLDEKLMAQQVQESDSEGEGGVKPPAVTQKNYPNTHWGRHNAKADLRKLRDTDLKTPEQIIKKRLDMETKMSREKAARLRNIQRKKNALKRRKKAKK